MDNQLQLSNSFKCPACGSDMNYDVSSKSLNCAICGRSNEAYAVNEEIMNIDFSKIESDDSLRDWGVESKTFLCDACGNETIDPNTESVTSCVFCGSPEIHQINEHTCIRPDVLIPFKIDVNKATLLFVEWIKKRRLAPFSLNREYRSGNIRGIYIPYWSYDANAHSSYTGQAGDYYNDNESYTSTVNGKTDAKTQRVQKIRWRFVSGSYDRTFKELMFNDSGIDQKVLQSLEPFRLGDLVKYDSRFLTGFFAERCRTGLKSVWERAKAYMDNVLREDIQETVKRGSDVLGKVNICTKYDDIKYRHMLLPVWTSSYHFRGKTYGFYINGQTGLVQGSSPKSALKIGGIILGIFAIAAVLYFVLKK